MACAIAARETLGTRPRASLRGSTRKAASITAGTLRSSTAGDAPLSSEQARWPFSQRVRIGHVASRFFAQQHEPPARTKPKPLARTRAWRSKAVAIARRTASILAQSRGEPQKVRLSRRTDDRRLPRHQLPRAGAR